ncbi:hypothetical protein RFI_09707 [Reticulomyxa filosa]|uniref:Uncharacterized protein n=1 Tax=Reticulomyxa filosa TaxID=46433 RepID=X6NN76_RETFI|nr:hypothetical protein RFI_09707 [Reticulomyxa filosa]|eukprot:ETO27426.1 hypothetical protein RFI_09707 [Reticulomyxa filosa]
MIGFQYTIFYNLNIYLYVYCILFDFIFFLFGKKKKKNEKGESLTNQVHELTTWTITNCVFNNVVISTYLFHFKSISLKNGLGLICHDNHFSFVTTETGALFYSYAGQWEVVQFDWNNNVFEYSNLPLVVTAGLHQVSIQNTRVIGFAVTNSTTFLTSSDAYFSFGFGAVGTISYVIIYIYVCVYTYIYFVDYFGQKNGWVKDRILDWENIHSWTLESGEKMYKSELYPLSPLIRNAGILNINDVEVQSNLRMDVMSKDLAQFINSLSYSSDYIYNFTMAFYYPMSGDFSQGVFVNDPSGFLTVARMKISSNSYSAIVSNFGLFEGDSIQNGLYLDYLEDPTAFSNRWNYNGIGLDMVVGFFTAGNSFQLTNCHLWGFYAHNIIAIKGAIVLENVDLQYAPRGLIAKQQKKMINRQQFKKKKKKKQ